MRRKKSLGWRREDWVAVEEGSKCIIVVHGRISVKVSGTTHLLGSAIRSR